MTFFRSNNLASIAALCQYYIAQDIFFRASIINKSLSYFNTQQSFNNNEKYFSSYIFVILFNCTLQLQDAFILETAGCVYVWLGKKASKKEKTTAYNDANVSVLNHNNKL